MTTSELLREAGQLLHDAVANTQHETIRNLNLMDRLIKEADRLEGVEQAEAIKRGGLKMGESISSMWEDRGKPRVGKKWGVKKENFQTHESWPSSKPKPYFKECYECAKKPGSPILCSQCLWVRDNWDKTKCRQCLHPEEKGICTCGSNPLDQYKPKPEKIEEIRLIGLSGVRDIESVVYDGITTLNTLIRRENERNGYE